MTTAAQQQKKKRALHWECEAHAPCWKCALEARAQGKPWWTPVAIVVMDEDVLRLRGGAK